MRAVPRHAALALAALVALTAAQSSPPAPAPASSRPPSPLASKEEAGDLLSVEASAAAKSVATEAVLTGKATGAASLFGNVYVGDVSCV